MPEQICWILGGKITASARLRWPIHEVGRSRHCRFAIADCRLIDRLWPNWNRQSAIDNVEVTVEGMVAEQSQARNRELQGMTQLLAELRFSPKGQLRLLPL